MTTRSSPAASSMANANHILAQVPRPAPRPVCQERQESTKARKQESSTPLAGPGTPERPDRGAGGLRPDSPPSAVSRDTRTRLIWRSCPPEPAWTRTAGPAGAVRARSAHPAPPIGHLSAPRPRESQLTRATWAPRAAPPATPVRHEHHDFVWIQTTVRFNGRTVAKMVKTVRLSVQLFGACLMVQ